MKIDYCSLIDELNDKGLRFCVENLFALLNYKFLTIEDVRRVDLKEKIIPMINEVRRINNGIDVEFLFISILKYYLRLCNCSGRAARYKEQILNRLENEIDSSILINDLRDAVCAFLSFFRIAGDIEHVLMRVKIDDVDFDVYAQDAEILRKLYKSKTYSSRFTDRKVKNKDSDAKEFFYITSILLLSLMLQERGAFENN